MASEHIVEYTGIKELKPGWSYSFILHLLKAINKQ
ncbi:GDSL family lipase [Wolbachia endosymbiont of Cimex lectularius]|nr:GDSL family lipase [Wolbachia endosymbiont of Cimex lectularius]